MSSVLLLSGGMDSALCLKRYHVLIDLAVGFDYGQKHLIELDYAEKLAEKFDVMFERHVLPFHGRVDDIEYAGRNAVLLSHGAAMAQKMGCDSVIIGCNFTDAMRFPDCKPDFIREISKAFVSAYGVKVSAPLLTMTKEQIKKEAEGLETWTCYSPTYPDDKPCGECYACKGLQC